MHTRARAVLRRAAYAVEIMMSTAARLLRIWSAAPGPLGGFGSQMASLSAPGDAPWKYRSGDPSAYCFDGNEDWTSCPRKALQAEVERDRGTVEAEAVDFDAEVILEISPLRDYLAPLERVADACH